MPRSVVLTSGGVRSSVAALLEADKYEVYCLFADYGQTPAQSQRRAVRSFARRIKAVDVVDIELPHVTQIADRRSSPQPTKAAERTLNGGLSAAPGLAMVLTGAALQYARRLGAERVVLALDDAADFTDGALPAGPATPERRRSFLHLLGVTFEEAQPGRTRVHLATPFLDHTTADVIQMGRSLRMPFELTYSCHARASTPCGDCFGCEARESAFRTSDIPDPALGLVH